MESPSVMRSNLYLIIGYLNSFQLIVERIAIVVIFCENEVNFEIIIRSKNTYVIHINRRYLLTEV